MCGSSILRACAVTSILILAIDKEISSHAGIARWRYNNNNIIIIIKIIKTNATVTFLRVRNFSVRMH